MEILGQVTVATEARLEVTAGQRVSLSIPKIFT